MMNEMVSWIAQAGRAARDGFAALNPPSHQVQRIVEGYNLEWAAAGLFMTFVFLGVYLHARWEGNDAIATFALGGALEEQGKVFRMGYWWVASELAPAGETYASWAFEYRWWLFFPIQLSVIGVCLMARPVLRRMFWWLLTLGLPARVVRHPRVTGLFGHAWWVLPLSFAAAFFWLGYADALQLRPVLPGID